MDTNVFYNAYCPIEDSTTADWILSQLTADYPGITCEWTVGEIFCAFKKQVNLGVIEEEKAADAIDFFLADIAEMTQSKTLKLIPVTMGTILSTRTLIFGQNLYTADAVHAVTAMNAKVSGFITYDNDFSIELQDVQILFPQNKSFQEDFQKMKAPAYE